MDDHELRQLLPIRKRNLLRYWTQKRGLSIEGLARAIGASEVHVRKVGQGTAAASKRFRAACAMALGVPVEAIWPAPSAGTVRSATSRPTETIAAEN